MRYAPMHQHRNMNLIAKFVLILLVCASLLYSVDAGVGPPDEADYPVKYEVTNTSLVGGGLIGNFCTMGLRDLANPGIAFIVQHHGYGGCHVWDAGTVFHGRREKNQIVLLVQDKGKLKVEHWPIASTIAVNPNESGVRVAVAKKDQEFIPSGMGSLFIASIPDAADIYVDGEFMGNSPATLKLKLGKHTISAKMAGHQDWGREITVSGGAVNLNAKLTVGSNIPASTSEVTTRTAPLAPAASSSPRTERGWIGVSTRRASDGGAVIAGLIQEGPAAMAGLKVGDTIMKLNGNQISDDEDFESQISAYKSGSKVAVTYMRGSWASIVIVTVGVETL
jgi:hypothetical protein